MPANHSLPRLFLASQSPRRKQLLESIGLSFEVVLPNSEEEHPGPANYREVILSNAVLKAESVMKNIPNDRAVVISADTLVVLQDQVLGKPRDIADAEKMLKSMSGKMQQVFTGLALKSKKFGSRHCLVESRVYFRELGDEEIRQYVRTIEPYDKAGAYAVQGVSAVFIDRIEGSYTNVMGLPVEKFLSELDSLTKIPLFQWVPQLQN